MEKCEINIPGKASRLIKANRYLMSVGLFACAKDVDTVSEVQTKFIEHLTKIVETHQDNKITVKNVSFTSNKDEVKALGLIPTTSTTIAVRCHIFLNVANIQDIVGNIAALFNNYREKVEKGVSIKINSYGEWSFTEGLLKDTELELYGLAYTDAITKAKNIIEAMRHGNTCVNNISDNFVVTEVSEGNKYNTGRNYMTRACLDGELAAKPCGIADIDTSESIDLNIGEPEEREIDMTLSVKLTQNN